jgi:hypothetical protein
MAIFGRSWLQPQPAKINRVGKPKAAKVKFLSDSFRNPLILTGIVAASTTFKV